jgi:hypothetical protein
LTLERTSLQVSPLQQELPGLGAGVEALPWEPPPVSQVLQEPQKS